MPEQKQKESSLLNNPTMDVKISKHYMQGFEQYEAFKLLILLNIVLKDKFVMFTSYNSKHIENLITDCIIKDIISFSSQTLKVIDKSVLTTSDKNAVKEYIINSIVDYGFNYNILKDEFLKNFDKSQAPKYYKINDCKHIPFVLMEYAQNENFIKDIHIAINNIAKLFENLNNTCDLMQFEIIVDISCLLEDISKSCKKIKNTKKAKAVKFANKQQKIYHYLIKYIKEYGTYGIDYYSLQNFIKKLYSDPNKAIFELNKKYKQINNTEQYLIKYDRELEQYLIDSAIACVNY